MSLVFQNFGILIESLMKFCMAEQKNFSPKIGNMSQEQSFLNLLQNLVINFYRISSIMKMYIICCVPAQIPIFEKIFVLELWAKMFPASQIASMFNQPYHQNESVKLIFCMLTQIHIN